MTNNADKALVVTIEEGNISLLRANTLESYGILPKDEEKEINSWPFAIRAESIKDLLIHNNLSKSPMTLKEVLASVSQKTSITNITEIKEEQRFTVPNRKTSLIHIIDADKKLLKIKFSDIVWDKIHTWVDMTTQEISGMGCVTRTKNNSFLVYDVFLLKQENTSAFTDIDDQALQELMWELIQKDDKDKGHRITDLKFWWHSHANMSVNWSGQDDKCIAEKLQHADWWLSTVVNKRKEHSTRLDTSAPAFRFNNLGCELEHKVHPTIKEFCKKEYDKKVIEESKIPLCINNKTYDPYSYYKTAEYKQYTTYNHKSLLENYSKAEIETRSTTSQTLTALETPDQVSILIPTNGKPYRLKTTLDRAKDLHFESISGIRGYTEIAATNLDIGTINIQGYAFNPEPMKTNFDDEDFINWICSGFISCNNNHYLITAHHDEPGVLCISKIIGLCYQKNNKVITLTNSIKIPDNKFATIGIEYNPCLLIKDNKGPQQGVGIIIETTNPWPENKLGLDLYANIEEITSDFEDSITDIETTPSLFQEVQIYSEKTSEVILEDRINNIIKTVNRSILIDIFETLSSEYSKDAKEQLLENDARYLTTEHLIVFILRFAKRDVRQAFPWVWNCLPCEYVCLQCYEPVTTKDTQCPYCNLALSSIREEEGIRNV